MAHPSLRPSAASALLALLSACGSPALIDDGQWHLAPAPTAASTAGALTLKQVHMAALVDQFVVTLRATTPQPTTLHAKDIRVRRAEDSVRCAAFLVRGQLVASIDLPRGETQIDLMFDTDPIPDAVDHPDHPTVLELGGALPGSMTLLSPADGPMWRPKVADIVGLQVDWGQARLDGAAEPISTTRLALTAQLQAAQWFFESGLGFGVGTLEAEAASVIYTEVFPTITLGYAATAGRVVITPTLDARLGFACPKDTCSLALGEWGGGLRLGLMPTSAHPAVQNTRPPVELTVFAGQAIVGQADGWAFRLGVRVRPFAHF